jgi:hypothetical protein
MTKETNSIYNSFAQGVFLHTQGITYNRFNPCNVWKCIPGVTNTQELIPSYDITEGLFYASNYNFYPAFLKYEILSMLATYKQIDWRKAVSIPAYTLAQNLIDDLIAGIVTPGHIIDQVKKNEEEVNQSLQSTT